MSENTKKILMGAFMAALGAVATYALDALPMLAIPPALMPLATAGLGALINAIRKWGLFTPKPVDPTPTPVPAPPLPSPTPTDWKDALLKLLGEAIRDAISRGDRVTGQKLMGLVGDVEEAHS